jgi:hypothetical protein
MNGKEISEEESIFSFRSRSSAEWSFANPLIHSHSFLSDSGSLSSGLVANEKTNTKTPTVTPGSISCPLEYIQKGTCSQNLLETGFGSSAQNIYDIDEGPSSCKTHELGNALSISWLIQFESLQAFKATYGHCNVPQKYPANKRLGIWVNKQRTEFKKRENGTKSSLTDERVALLEGIGFVWAKRRGMAAWNKRMAELERFYASNGHFHINAKTPLGRWVSTQRQQYRLYSKGEQSTLTVDKIHSLEALGFTWRHQAVTPGTDFQCKSTNFL